MRFWDDTETLSCSYRLNTSYHPRYRYVSDLRGLADKAAVFIGDRDEAVDARRLQKQFARVSPASLFAIVSDTGHFGAFTSPAVHEMLIEWLAQNGRIAKNPGPHKNVTLDAI